RGARTQSRPDGARSRARRRRTGQNLRRVARRRRSSQPRRDPESNRGGKSMSDSCNGDHDHDNDLMHSDLVHLDLQPVVNPVEQFLRSERVPHIWCPGCGIGTTVNSFTRALVEAKVDLTKTVVVSGIGCTGRVAGYVDLDSFHTTHGRAIPFATGLKMANPDLHVVVYSGDGDLI